MLGLCSDGALLAYARTSDQFGFSTLGARSTRAELITWLTARGHYPLSVAACEAVGAAAAADSAAELDGASDADDADEEPPAKAQRRLFNPAAAAAVADAACTHCGAVIPGATPPGTTCHGCTLYPFLGEGHVLNAVIVRRLNTAASPASAGPGQSIDTGSTVAEAPKLSAADRELERLAAEGADWPRFALTDHVSSDDVFKDGRFTYRGASTAKLSASLIKLIRSGRFTQLSLVLPRDAAAAAVADANTGRGALKVDASTGQLQAHATLAVRPLADMGELMEAYFYGVLPALFDRPRALLDWSLLMRTAITINKTFGWPTAWEYVGGILSDAVPQREPFFAYQARIIDESRAAAGRNHGTPPLQALGHGAPFGAAPPLAGGRHGEQYRANVCREWNFSSCPDPCRHGRLHNRCAIAMCNKPEPHRAANCPFKASLPSNDYPGAYGARGGGGGGSGGSGGAHRGNSGRGGRAGGRGGGPSGSPRQ